MDYRLSAASERGYSLRAVGGEVLAIVFALCLGVPTTLYVQGYEFGRSNQTVYLLDALRQSRPDLLQNDWLVTDTLRFHSTFGWLTEALMRANVLEAGFFIGYLALVVLLHVAWLRLVLRLGGSHVTYLISVLIFYASYEGLALGRFCFLQDHAFLPSNLANVAMLWGVYLWVAARRTASAVLLGVAALFHFNHALVGAALWTFLSAWDLLAARRAGAGLAKVPAGAGDEVIASEGGLRWRVRSFLLGLGIIIGLSLPNSVPVVLGVLSKRNGLPLQEFVDLFVRLRGPHHFDPSSWPVGLWLAFLWPIPLAVLAARRIPQTAAVRDAVRVFFFFGALIVVALLGAGIWYVSESLVLMHFFRFSIFPKLLACIGAAYVFDKATQRMRRRRPRTNLLAVSVGAVVLGLVVLNSFGVSPVDALKESKRAVRMLVFLSAATVVCACIGATTYRRLRTPFYAMGVLALVAQVTLGCFRWLGVIEPTPSEANYSALCDWAREPAHTPLDAVFLVPPQEQAFRMRAHRAVVVNFKGIPQLSSEIPEWRDRLEAVIGIPDLRQLPRGLDAACEAMAARYDAAPAEHLSAVANRYGARYVVVTHRSNALEPGRLVYENASYRLYDLER